MVPAIGEVGIHLDDSAIVSGVRVHNAVGRVDLTGVHAAQLSVQTTLPTGMVSVSDSSAAAVSITAKDANVDVRNTLLTSPFHICARTETKGKCRRLLANPTGGHYLGPSAMASRGYTVAAQLLTPEVYIDDPTSNDPRRVILVAEGVDYGAAEHRRCVVGIATRGRTENGRSAAACPSGRGQLHIVTGNGNVSVWNVTGGDVAISSASGTVTADVGVPGLQFGAASLCHSL